MRCDDKKLFSLIREKLFTALVGDVLDAMGHTHCFLPPRFRPLRPDFIIIGRAMTVLEADCCGKRLGNGDEQAFGAMFEALDSLKENEVYICTGGSADYARWGGLMSRRAAKLKAAGAVLDGYSRDTKQILALNFPTFSLGVYAQDQGPRGRVIDHHCPLRFDNGVEINPGDLIFADDGGVLAIPNDIEQEAIEAALEKARGENLVADAIAQGKSTQEAFKTFGIM